jgi:integrase
VQRQRTHEGIEIRHSKKCRSRQEQRCNCRPTYQANVWSNRDRRRIRRTFPSLAAAKAWRREAQIALERGVVQAPSATTVRMALDALVAGMADGSVLDRSGRRYKPATRRSYEQAARKYLIPRLGSRRLSDVSRRDVQALVDELHATGLSPSTIHNKLDPLRVLYRRAIRRDELTVDPTDGLDLPSVGRGRDRIEAPDQAQALLAALPATERAFWAIALFAGLRRGELRALRWSDVDLERNVLRVARAWDDYEGEQEPKSFAGRGTVPLAGLVRRELVAHKLATGRSGEALVFGRTESLPFVPTTIRARARKAWEAAGQRGLTPHEARHCAVSYFIACGMNPKQISVYVGHGDVRQTWNRYGHLMPGDEEHAAAKLDAFLDAPARQSRDNEPGSGAVESG